MIYLILGLILFLYIIRRSNTSDLIKQANITNDEEINKFEEAVLLIKSTRFSVLLLAITLISIIVIALIRHTTIELFFLNYFGTGIFRDDKTISYTYYALPFFILIIRGIIIEVNIGDYIKKNYALTEEEISVTDAAKSILFKPKKKTEPEIETLELETPAVALPTTPTPQEISQAPAPLPTPVAQPVAPVAPVAPVTNDQNSNL